MINDDGVAMAAPVPWWRRSLRRLFPYVPQPVVDAQHGVWSTTHVRMDWRDRVRVLASGHLQVCVATDTTLDPGGVVQTRVTFCVRPPGEPS